MNSDQRLKYLSRQGMNCMNRIEEAHGRMMSEINGDLEARWYQALDNKDLIRLNGLYNELCKLVDESEENYVSN